jgi:hypothetical protein
MPDIEDRIDSLFGTGPEEESNNSDGNTTGTNDTANTPPAGTQPPAQQQDSDAGRSDPAAQGGDDGRGQAGKGGGANAGKEQQAATKPQAQQPPATTPPARDPNALYDRQGQLIARAGAERRFYETAQRAQSELGRVNQRLQQTETELAAYKQAASLPTELGLSPADVTTAMQFMAHYRRDPVGAMRNAIAETLAAGHNIDGMGDTNHAAIARMMDQRLAPFTAEREEQRRQQEAKAAADREVDDTFREFPWASQNIPALQQVMQAAPHMRIRDVAMQVELWALRNGYDVNGDLIAQSQAAAQAAPAQQQNQQTQPAQQPQRQPNPAMQQAPLAGTGGVQQRPAEFAPTGMRTRDILRDVFREHGIQLNN